MRRIKIFTNPDTIHEIGKTFTHHNIPFSIDSHKETDIESPHYAQMIFSLFVENENDIPRALSALEEISPIPKEASPSTILPGPCKNNLQSYLQKRFCTSFSTKKPLQKRTFGFCTISIFCICISLFILDSFSDSSTPSFKEKFLFDTPTNQIHKNTPSFRGLYSALLEKKTSGTKTPLFPLDSMAEKIKEGQYWRLFSPCLLHGDIFHLVFNMMWLLALGIPIEKKISPLKFLLLLSTIALVSNIAQYSMSGPNFLGISGVLFGLIGFTAKRNDDFPWEGYSLRPQTYSSILFFMWSLAFLSFIAFLTNWYFSIPFSVHFANTAHITGFCIGIILGKLSFFSAKKMESIV